MSKLKSIMQNRTQGHLGEQQRNCSDCVHVMPGMTGDEVTCEIYTFKYEVYKVRRRNSISPGFANDCGYYQAMTPVQKAESKRKFREFYKRLK